MERGGAVFAVWLPRPLGPSRMPASGLNGGVGKTTLPILRPRSLPTLINWPRADAPDSSEKASNRASTTALRNRVIAAELSRSGAKDELPSAEREAMKLSGQPSAR